MTPKVKKKHRPKPIVQKNIPADPSATITTREFKRSSTSHLLSIISVSSSRSSTPLPVGTTHEPSDDTAETQQYSDIDEELLEEAQKKKSKGASRSVSVSTPQFSSFVLPLKVPVLTQSTDITGGMAPAPG